MATFIIGVYREGKKINGYRIFSYLYGGSQTTVRKVSEEDLISLLKLRPNAKLSNAKLNESTGKIEFTQGGLTSYPVLDEQDNLTTNPGITVAYAVTNDKDETIGFGIIDSFGMTANLSKDKLIRLSSRYKMTNWEVYTTPSGESSVRAKSGSFYKVRKQNAVKISPINSKTDSASELAAKKAANKKAQALKQEMDSKREKLMKDVAEEARLDEEALITQKLEKGEFPTVTSSEIISLGSDNILPCLKVYNFQDVSQEEINKGAQWKLVEIKSNMMKISPYYASMMDAIKKVPCTAIDTMGVTEDTLFYNPIFLATLSVPEATFIYIHEMLHIAEQHSIRHGNRNNELWNIACDLYINEVICRDYGVTFGGDPVTLSRTSEIDKKTYSGVLQTPSNGIFLSSIGETLDFGTETVETIYNRLYKENPNGASMPSMPTSNQSSQAGQQGQQSGQSSGQQSSGQQSSGQAGQSGQGGQQTSNMQAQMSQGSTISQQGSQTQSAGQQQGQQGQGGQQGTPNSQDPSNPQQGGMLGSQGQQNQQQGGNQSGQSGQPQSQGQQQGNQGTTGNQPSGDGQGGSSGGVGQGGQGSSGQGSSGQGNSGVQNGQNGQNGQGQGQNGQGQQGDGSDEFSQLGTDASANTNDSSLYEDSTTSNNDSYKQKEVEVEVTYRGKKIRAKVPFDVLSNRDTVSRDNPKISMDETRTALKRIQVKKEMDIAAGKDMSLSSGSQMIDREIKFALTVTYNWEQLLKNICNSSPKKTYTLASPNVEYSNMGMTVATRQKIGKNTKITNLKFAVDVSGSIGDNELHKVFTKIAQILKSYEVEAEMIYWDTEVTNVGDFEDMRGLLKIKPTGSGGTDVRCVFDYLMGKTRCKGKKESTKVKDISGLFIFTDGFIGSAYGDYARYFGRKTFWIIDDSSPAFEGLFGKVAKAKLGRQVE